MSKDERKIDSKKLHSYLIKESEDYLDQLQFPFQNEHYQKWIKQILKSQSLIAVDADLWLDTMDRVWLDGDDSDEALDDMNDLICTMSNNWRNGQPLTEGLEQL